MTQSMRWKALGLFLFCLVSFGYAAAQGTVPTFVDNSGGKQYTLMGADPAKGATTTIPTVLAPVTLSFESKKVAGKPYALNAGRDVPALLRSPIFAHFKFGPDNTQYADAMLRSTFPNAKQ
ncbi:MAG TPA: glycoside hydrolase, partial [Edaphobacter sp.]|nr:glycoside hydrolase [Edaphobacter sp.]